MNRKRISLSRADIINQNAAVKLSTQPVVGKRVAPCSDSPEKENQNDGLSRQLLFDSVIMNTFGLFICLHVCRRRDCSSRRSSQFPFVHCKAGSRKKNPVDVPAIQVDVYAFTAIEMAPIEESTSV